MGMATTNVIGRVMASFSAPEGFAPTFQNMHDIPNGGVLLSLPSLLANGLLYKTHDCFSMQKGYYQLEHIFILLSFMSLSRIKNIESLRHVSPGEWGNLIGLDRIPEVKTLRKKISQLSKNNSAFKWSDILCSLWVSDNPDESMKLYIDGHVRVYHGNQTKLPKHYVAREKLCLRATTDYWVNAMNSNPFLFINKAVDPGMIHVIENDIIPQIKKKIPESPSSHRFTIIFDREGYSPDFFLRMKVNHQVACITYNKNIKDHWDEEEFMDCTVKLSSGEVTVMKLAERGVYQSGKIWLREIRKLTTSGYQVSILSTDYESSKEDIGSSLFARWSQENYFKYMRENFGLDALIDHSLEEVDDTITVVNPEYRRLDSSAKSLNAKLSRNKAKFGAIMLDSDIEDKNVQDYEKKRSQLHEEILQMERELQNIKNERKNCSKHIPIRELPEEFKFKKLNNKGKHLIDTVKMIAYRAETAMANIIKPHLNRSEAHRARTIIKSVYSNEADIIVDKNNNILNVNIHHIANAITSKNIRILCEEINKTETKFPGTNLIMKYNLVSNFYPPGQEL